MYLLDANILIRASRDWYRIRDVPQFWTWLVRHGEAERIKIPREIYKEFSDTTDTQGNRDALADWACKQEVRSALILDEELDRGLRDRIVLEGYLCGPTEKETQQMGKDPSLLAYALSDYKHRVIVTAEKSKPSKKKGNCKIPDVARRFCIKTIGPFELTRALHFNTK